MSNSAPRLLFSLHGFSQIPSLHGSKANQPVVNDDASKLGGTKRPTENDSSLSTSVKKIKASVSSGSLTARPSSARAPAPALAPTSASVVCRTKAVTEKDKLSSDLQSTRRLAQERATEVEVEKGRVISIQKTLDATNEILAEERAEHNRALNDMQDRSNALELDNHYLRARVEFQEKTSHSLMAEKKAVQETCDMQVGWCCSCCC